MRAYCVWAGLVAVGLAACGGEDGDPPAEVEAGALPEVVVRDSAGVSIRTTPRARISASEWRVDATPVAVFDGTEGGLEPFHLIASMTFESDSSLILGEMAMTRLRRYTLGGGFDRTIGHPGEGPGEFGAMNHLGLVHDSLVVFDSRFNRISVFDPDREFARSFTLESVGGRARFAGLFPDGRILALAAIPGDDRHWGVWDLEGNSLGLLADVDPLPALTMRMVGQGPAEPMRPFQPFRFGAEASGHILWLDDGTYRFDLLDPTGRLVASERLDLPPRVIDADRRERWKRNTIANMQNARPDLVRSVEEAIFPETMPSFGTGSVILGPTAVLDDEQGRIWVAEYPATAPQRWFVFRAEGGLDGHVTLPERFELEAVRGDLLMGVQKDEFDVQTAVVYRLRTGG